MSSHACKNNKSPLFVRWSRLLKPNGVLVYSTCSLEPEENRGVVDAVLNEISILRLRRGKGLASISRRIRWRLRSCACLRRGDASCIKFQRWNRKFLCMTRALIASRNFLVEYSVRLKQDENVLIESFDIPDEMTIALVRAARNVQAQFPFVQVQRGQSQPRPRTGRERAANRSGGPTRIGPDEKDGGLHRHSRQQ